MGSPEHPTVTGNKASRELIGQTSYSDVQKGPTLDNTFDPPFHGIEVLTDGNVQLETKAGQRTLPLSTGRVYPIEIHQVLSTNTTVNASDIMLYAK